MIKGVQNHDVTLCNDNEALIERINNEKLHGNYGLHSGMDIIITIRKMK